MRSVPQIVLVYFLMGQCENMKLWKMYFPEMNFGYTHKNKIVLENEKKIKNAPYFAIWHLKNRQSP